MNLTRITKKEDVAIKHFLDSIMAESFIPKNSKVIDIGAGAGFPSIPLKIIRDDLSFTLVDSVKKKVDFLNDTTEKLDLSKIKAIHARSEDLAHDIEFREKFDVCIARAVAELNILCEYCLPFVKQGGLFIAYKSISCEEEIERAKKAMEKLGGELQEIYYYEIQEDRSNCLVIIRKKGRTSEKYPRRNNKPRKEPII
jgi:16S rRNA (guanine527-N7)-methyltransferase